VDEATADAAAPGAGTGESCSAVDSMLRKVAHVSHLSLDPPLPRLGQIIGEKYRIEARLGRGGMGVVFRATHLVSRKAVALKWMLRSTTDGQAHRRLLREARAAGRIDHPNVVDVYDVGEEGACAYLVMELLHGEALRARLERGRLESREAIDLLLPALSGVSAAHRAGVIHRDLKPDNIFLCTGPDGSAREAKVLDFGVSAVSAQSTIDPALTDRATLLGTPAYMSPEQLASARDTDARTDVYALGVILYEALTGRLPFVAESHSGLIRAVAQDPPTLPRERCPDIPRELERVILGALSKQRQDRPQTVDALRDLLVPFGSAQQLAPPPRPRARRAADDRYRGAAGHWSRPAPLASDRLVASRYRLRRCISEGGTGAIFEAEHVTTERRVALKLLFPHVVSAGNALDAFEREAKVSARVNSPYIVEVQDAGYDEELESPFLVMELLDGQTLDERVLREGPLQAESALRLLRQVALGLDAAHAYREPGGTTQPIVHRNLKPKNLFLARQRDGTLVAKILDYGIATMLDETGHMNQHVRGTPLFMSFEQITAGTLSPQTDIWAFGLIAFYALTGARYWRSSERAGSNLQALFAEILTLPLEAPSVRLREQSSSIELPSAFDAWLLRCIDRVPERRFASAGAAVEALAQVFSRAPLPALASPSRPRAAPTRARRAALMRWGAAGAVAVALLLGAVVWLMSRDGEAPAAPPRPTPPRASPVLRWGTPAQGDELVESADTQQERSRPGEARPQSAQGHSKAGRRTPEGAPAIAPQPGAIPRAGELMPRSEISD